MAASPLRGPGRGGAIAAPSPWVCGPPVLVLTEARAQVSATKEFCALRHKPVSVICINVVTNNRNVLIFHVCQFLPGPTGLDSASEPCVPSVYLRPRSVHLHPWCLPASTVSTCIPGVCLLPQCPPASLVSACFRSVYLHPWCLPASAVSTCIPGVCLLPQCLPVPSVVRPCNSRTHLQI